MKDNSIKILAIDDAEENLEELAAAVQEALPGAVFYSASGGEAGLALASAKDPDVILLDIMMPRVDGFETCRRLKAEERLRDIPVIFMTSAKPDGAICREAFESGGDAFLIKPLEICELAVQARAMMKIRSASLKQRTENARLQETVDQRTRELELQLAALRQSEDQLRQAQKLEIAGALAGGIAHDFNNMLSAILTYSDLLVKALPEGDPRRADAEEIRKTGLRGAALTRQLLAFSRKQVLQPKVLDIGAVIEGMRGMLATLLGESIRLAVVARGGAALVKADQGYLEQVIMNLCVNARDAMPRGGKVTLEASVLRMDTEYRHRHGTLLPGAYVMLAVTDTGCGMSPAVQARIFEPFFTTKPRDKGTGLGLPTVDGIVRQSGGSIAVYSEEGRGSVFKIFFPLAADKTAAALTPPARQYAAARGTVLVVDDDGQVKSLASRTLAEDGLTVVEASSAEEALLLCERRAEPIDLLLTDMVLPGMTGIELSDRLKPLFPGLRVIYMSGYTDQTVLENGMLAPEKFFLQKPFTLDLLTQKTREALSQPPR